jgi:hypothetical protein
MFHNQPLVHRFGKALTDDLVSEEWRRAEFAVAWVRRSGTKYLSAPFRSFLKSGGTMQITVGVDIENTSHEGLGDLLALEKEGSIETFIHHNEADVTFHPKVYLLRNDDKARLIVGSNNLTKAGLFLNTEAGLQIDAPLTDPVITAARTALAAWRDPSSGFARRLDKTLLNDLLALGYIHPESDLRQRRKGSAQAKKKIKTAESALFKNQRVTGPEVRKAVVKAWNVAGTVLLLRVRRASENERRTQVQIPIKIVRTAFFTGITEVVSAHDARTHPLIEASARSSVNTIKAEIPEIATMGDPVLRLERTPNAIVYTAFDGASVLGTPIREALLHGFAMNPPSSFQTIADRSRATWWRFV